MPIFVNRETSGLRPTNAKTSGWAKSNGATSATTRWDPNFVEKIADVLSVYGRVKVLKKAAVAE
jgi:hypothetical protein